MSLRLRVVACVVPSLLVAAGCKTSESSSAVKSESDATVTEGEPALPVGQADFCVSEAQTRQDLQNWTADLWAQAFSKGLASADLIPGADHPGIPAAGKGFPRIFSKLVPNKIANKLWDGKTMMTTEDGTTGLVNRFIPVGDEFSIDLLSASVVVDEGSKMRDGDGKPVILLDYRQTKLTGPNDSFDELNFFNVPVIKAIRDEIRLVCQKTENGVRRRLYLGPTFLLPDEFKSSAGKKLAKKFEVDPILWFALEFEDSTGT